MCPAGQQYSTMIIYNDNIKIYIYIAAQSHCFADLFCRCMIIQYQSTSYMCAKAFWSSQDAQVLWMIRTCRSWITPEHGRTISRKLKKNNLKKSFGFRRSLKALSLWYPFGCAISADHVRTVLIFVNSHSDSWISVQIEAILKGWPAHFFWCWCFVSLSQERDECSEEIIRMRGLDEKYEAEISQLAKDSQVVSSFTWDVTII